jgi:protein-L-isoaspartate(D-aspartate) O-methyltransferase
MLNNNYRVVFAIFVILFAFTSLALAGYREEREKLVKRHIIGEGIKDRAVIRSMRTVPREEFVLPEHRKKAYINHPLPIGYGQTISQPYIVALMTELLKVDEDDTVLEIGTGSGYQAAILAEIVRIVCTIEIIKPLADRAEKVFQRLHYTNIESKFGDGYFGWEEYAPFDAIIVTAAVDHIPPPLIKQLEKGGRMCIPVGQPYFTQVLKLIEKDENGEIRVHDIIPVIFVPLTRELVE